MNYMHLFMKAGFLSGVLALLLAITPATSTLAAPVSKVICEDGLVYNPDKKKCDCTKTKYRNMGLSTGSRFAVCSTTEALNSNKSKSPVCDSKSTLINVDFGSKGAVTGDVTPLKNGDFLVSSVINSNLVKVVRFDKNGVQKGSFDVKPSAANSINASVWGTKYITLAELTNGSIVVAWVITPGWWKVNMVFTVVDSSGVVVVPQKTVYPLSSPPSVPEGYIDSIGLDNGGFMLFTLPSRTEVGAFRYDKDGGLVTKTVVANAVFEGNNVSAIKIPNTNNIAVGWSGATANIVNSFSPFNLAVISQDGVLVSGPAYGVSDYVIEGFGFLPLSNGKIAVARRGSNNGEMYVQNFNQDLTPSGGAVAVRQPSTFTGWNFQGMGMAPLDGDAGYLAATWDFLGDSGGVSKQDDVYVGAYSNDNVLQGGKELYFGKSDDVFARGYIPADYSMRNRMVKMADGKIALFLKDKFEFYDGDTPYCTPTP